MALKPSVAIVLGCWGVFLVFWTVAAVWVKATKEKQPLWERVLHLAVIALIILLLRQTLGGALLTRVLLPYSLLIGVVADLLVILGLVIAIWARAVLGTNWSARVTLKIGHELIETGPYRVVRHPIYSGLLLMVLGTAILTRHVGGFVAFLIYVVSIWMKLRREEKLMTKHFPEYPKYTAGTKALIPFLF